MGQKVATEAASRVETLIGLSTKQQSLFHELKDTKIGFGTTSEKEGSIEYLTERDDPREHSDENVCVETPLMRFI